MPTDTWARITIPALALTFSLAVAGCSSAPAVSPAGTSSASSSASVKPSTPAPAPTPTATIGKPYIVKGTRAEYSSAQLKSAWKYATEFAAKYCYNPAMMNTTKKQVTKKLLQPIRAQIGDPDVLAEFDKDIAAFARTKDNEGDGIGLALVGLNGDGYRMAATPVTGLHIDGTMSVVAKDDSRLATKLMQRAQVHYFDTDKQGPMKMAVTHTVTLYLEPKGTGWVITGYNWEGNSGDYVPDN